MFGSPLSTSYDNWLVFQNGELGRFSQENLYLLLFDKVSGLLWSNWSQIGLGIIGAVLLADRKSKNAEIFFLSSFCMVFALALLSLRFINCPVAGNRYLLFIPMCYFPIMVEVIEWGCGLVFEKFSDRKVEKE